MFRRKTITIGILSAIATCLAVGCDKRVAEVAQEAADRQAEQNRTMAQLQQEVAGGTKSLVKADARARQEILRVHRDIQSERTEMDQQWNALERERKQLAAERRTASLLVPAVEAVAWIALAAVVIGFCWYALVWLRAEECVDSELSEFLIQEFAGDESRRLSADPTVASGRQLPDARSPGALPPLNH